MRFLGDGKEREVIQRPYLKLTRMKGVRRSYHEKRVEKERAQP
jgi:hypothetical protein